MDARARRRARLAGGSGDGGALRAPLPGLARGLPADRAPRPVRHLRGLRDGLGLDGDPARQVARGAAELAWRAPVPSLNVLLTSTCWRNDHNGFSHQGPGLIDTMISLRGERRPRLPAARRQLPAVRRRALPAQPQLREPDRHRQAAAAAVPGPRRGACSRRRRRLASGTGPARLRTSSPTSCWLRSGTCRRWRRWRRRRCCANGSRAAAARRQRRRPDATRAARRPSARADEDRLRDRLRRRRRGGLRLPRLRAGAPPAAPRPPSSRPLPCPRLPRAGHDDHARSTWSCSTG